MSKGFKVKKKPTIKEVSNIVIELSRRINSCMGFISELEKAFSLYVEMKKDNDNFSNYINKKVKEFKEQNDPERNGKLNPNDIPPNTGDKESRTEGIREEAK